MYAQHSIALIHFWENLACLQESFLSLGLLSPKISSELFPRSGMSMIELIDNELLNQAKSPGPGDTTNQSY